MKKSKLVLGLSLLTITGLVLVAADHLDAPAVSNNANDITDVYAFQGQNTNNMVLVVNTQGFLTPGTTGAATYNENVMNEINIDNNGDNVEDLVIQMINKGGKMYFFGPVAPGTTGATSTVKSSATAGSVDITQYGSPAVIGTSTNGMKFFAGPRDDPFFFDLNQFKAILNGTATGFNNPGTDTFAGTNVLSTIIELPKSMLGGTGNTINVWAETKQKQ